MIRDFAGRLKSVLGIRTGKTGEATSFRTVFTRFRDVLDNNNKALEIITEMGEKLGGEYLFDIHYIRPAYSSLASAVGNSMRSFDALTGGKYEKLHDAFERIDGRIRSMIYDIVSTSGKRVYFFEDITWDMAREVGGKNAVLAELKNYLALNVPGAFAITSRAFDEFMDYNGLGAYEDLQRHDNEALSASLSEMRDRIMNAEFPPDLDKDIDEVLGKIRQTCGEDCFLAVRSSGEEEDGDLSFAGQFATILNVPAKGGPVKDAYRRVIASLFAEKAATYQRRFGYKIGQLKMAVGCVAMVDAISSGVIYTATPGGDRDTLMITASWGLGASVVEGETDADVYLIKKDIEPRIVDRKAGDKEYMIARAEQGGTERTAVPDAKRKQLCLSDEQVIELSRQAVRIEKHFRKPQDIEWAIDGEGGVFILQARPLRVEEGPPGVTPSVKGAGEERILMENKGIVVQKGVGGGTVFFVTGPADLEHFPKGSVLVARHDSSEFARVMPYVSAIITDTGSPTSHMASLCREFRVPTVVNAGDASRTLRQGGKVTMQADDEGGVTVFEGILRERIDRAEKESMKMEDLYEYRRRRYILRYISPLNLVDPLMDVFTPEKCKTIHDILRFMHEKSVAELLESARLGTSLLKGHRAVKLDLPIPTGIVVLDIGGGLSVKPGEDKATLEQITSVPLRAIVEGMLHPGTWHSDAVSLRVHDFMSSMMRMSDITSDGGEYAGYNVAVASGEYVNLSLRFGYHFNMIDCYCSENTRNNHIYFRFVGGATDIVKRSRRIQLIAEILKEYGFNIKSKGDLIIARLSNIRQDEAVGIMDQTGRLIAYTRQLDAVLHDDADVELYAKNFLAGKYDIN